MEQKITIPIITILIILGLFIFYALYLLIKDKKRDNYVFFSYVLLIFVVIYSVSILNYKIGGSNISVEQIAKEEAGKVSKKVLVYLADSYVYSATEASRFSPDDFGLQKAMIEKREEAKSLYEEAGLKEEEIQTKIIKINELIAQDIIRDIESESKRELQKSNPDKRQEFENDFNVIPLTNKLNKSIPKVIKQRLEKYNISNKAIDSNIKTLEYFLENKKIEP